MEKRKLGRGLDALLGGDTATLENTNELALDRIKHNPYQPRKSFDTDEISSLSASIKSLGVLQPLVVRQVGEEYQLIAGERRLRAAQEAGLSSVPVRIVDFNDQQTLEAALVENVQRADLNPIEKAQGFKEYVDRFGISHDELAQRLGLARSTITNLINLLDLPTAVQDGLRSNQITETHAKILKSVRGAEKQETVFKQIVAMGLSVKGTENLLREQNAPAPEPAKKKEAPVETETPRREPKTAHVIGLETELRQKLATPVAIQLRSKDKGKIVIEFANNDDFMRVLEVIRGA